MTKLAALYQGSGALRRLSWEARADTTWLPESALVIIKKGIN